MNIKSRYTTYFYLFLFFVVLLLCFTASYSLSISYKEALNFYENLSLLSIIVKTSSHFFGHNDLALRLPFIIFYFLSSILMYEITRNYFKNDKDRLIAVSIFMLLPGVLSASLLVNTAIVVTFFTLLYVYYFERYKKHLYYLLPFLLLVDNSFAILFLALFFYGIKSKDKKLIYFTLVLFVLSVFIYELSTGGKPKGFLLDTFAIYSAIFSPFLFIYFLYTIYRLAILKEINLIWYIAFTAFILSFIVSFRQKVYIEDFAPFVVILIPQMLKIFLNAYRVRLKEFRLNYSIFAGLIVFMLFLNVILTFVNKPIYLILPNPEKHFVYQYHFAKELSSELKNRNINNIQSDEKSLLMRLRFYEIKEGDDYYISTSEFYNYDEKISIRYFNKELFTIYIKKMI